MTHVASETVRKERRFLALCLPYLATDRLRKTAAAPDNRPLVVVEKVRGAMRLVAVDARAEGLGLGPGLALADARARVPDLQVMPHDRAADMALLERLADWADRYTPFVAIDPPYGLVLDITGCAHLFGGEAAMRADILKCIRDRDYTVRAAIAGTQGAARALARLTRGGIVARDRDADAVRPLPVAALDLPDKDTLAFTRAGLKTIGDLADRPRETLTARFGAEAVTRLARLLGRADAPLDPRRPVAPLMAERRFAEPIVTEEDVKRSLAALTTETARALEARAEGGRAFEAAFFRVDGTVRRVTLETARPLREPEAILRLLEVKLEALATPLDPGFGFDVIRLSVPRLDPLKAAQVSLDARRDRDQGVAALVESLSARLGHDRVRRFSVLNSHVPECASRTAPALATSERADWPAPHQGEPPLRPLTLFDPPQPVEALAEVPDGPPRRFRWRRVLHHVIRFEGPERIAPEWWRDNEGALTRDYFRVEDSNGQRFWLYRAGLYGRESPAPCWFLHGLFA